MLDEEELHDLAESIKAEGLHKPLLLTPDGLLLDGRNRLAACAIAGIEPRFTTYAGDDHVRVIFSANALRRNLSKGQRAVILAIARSVSEHSLRTQAKLHAISLTRLSNTTTVLKYSPDLAEEVRIGALRLDSAYETARRRKAEAAALIARHEHLRQHAPDLADQVSEGILSLDQATTALDQQLEDARLQLLVAEMDAIRKADGDTAPQLTQRAQQGELTWHEAHRLAEEHRSQRQDAIHRTRQTLEQLAAHWPDVESLADRLNTPYAREVLDGLTPEARAVATRLTTEI
ncbi:ParB N-terminal domain-containing protein [Streptomyces sp. ISL-43]|uniref:ParB N-terminal domain-containing protein n=1 Tax=Streptomyces sp. ISL-43 TaxID=2819183 RepID=UPI001BE60B00|nr:ParB N-terminal domain-containing protein [Streptomyces sp. ISL-43]MBT2451810.1 ParB N-terminal domain-containing protein [Streptomyces sp. ISL-43]